MTTPGRLLAIVSVHPNKTVQCQQPGCGHKVYAAIHVVQEEEDLLVLGSTCFAKRYGGATALGEALYAGRGGGDKGNPLTDEERNMLATNTAELIARFKAEQEALIAAAAASQARLRVMPYQTAAQVAPVRRPAPPPPPPRPEHPWPWQHRQNTSVALFSSREGQYWVRVTHHNGTHVLVPWPHFPGWETALSRVCGIPDLELKGYVVPAPAIATAMNALHQQLGYSTPRVTAWPGILRLAPQGHRPSSD